MLTRFLTLAGVLVCLAAGTSGPVGAQPAQTETGEKAQEQRRRSRTPPRVVAPPDASRPAAAGSPDAATAPGSSAAESSRPAASPSSGEAGPTSAGQDATAVAAAPAAPRVSVGRHSRKLHWAARSHSRHALVRHGRRYGRYHGPYYDRYRYVRVYYPRPYYRRPYRPWPFFFPLF